MSDEGEFYSAQSVIYCDFCDTHVNVTWVCHTCNVSICQKCKEVHLTKKKFRDHNVRLRGEEQLLPPIRTTKCHKHRFIDVTAFCDGCKVPICVKCIVNEHKEHNVLDLKEAFDTYTVILRKMKGNISEESNHLACYRTKLHYENDRLNTQQSEALKQIKNEREEAVSSLNKVYDNLEKDVLQAKESQQKEMGKTLETCKENENFIEKMLVQFEKHEVSRDISIFKFVNECPDFSGLTPREISMKGIKFVPGSISSAYFEKLTGKVISEVECIPPSNRVMRSFMAPLSENEQNGANVMQLERSEQVWMSNVWSSKLYLYNSKGSKVTTISAGFGICGFEMYGNGDFIACDYDNMNVMKITRKGKVDVLIKSLSTSPCGICLNHKKEIVLCLLDHHVLFVYSPDGGRLRNKIGEKKEIFTKPFKLSQNSNRDYCVVDGFNKIVVVNEDGTYRWTYVGQKGEEFNPKCIVDDGFGCLVISDHDNHKIHRLDRNGQFLQILLTKYDGIEYPRALCVDKDGKLWIGQGDGKVHIVKYLSA